MSSRTTRTTTVEVVGTNPPDFSPPKNAVVLSEASHHTPDISFSDLGETANEQDVPRYKIVYQTVSRKEKKRKMKRTGGVNALLHVEHVERDFPMEDVEYHAPDHNEKRDGVEEWRGNVLEST